MKSVHFLDNGNCNDSGQSLCWSVRFLQYHSCWYGISCGTGILLDDDLGRPIVCLRYAALLDLVFQSPWLVILSYVRILVMVIEVETIMAWFPLLSSWKCYNQLNHKVISAYEYLILSLWTIHSLSSVMTLLLLTLSCC